MSKKDKVKYFDAREYVNRVLADRTDKALQVRNKQFAEEHAKDSKEQLIAYVLQCKDELGHTPHMAEVIGGAFIGYRFCGWAKVLEAAGLPAQVKTPAPTGRKIYRDELKNQTRLWKQEKEAAKAENAVVRELREEQAQEEQAIRRERDKSWGTEHSEDTDEELLDYVKVCAKELGQTPRKKEVAGGEYICKRIGSWALVCTLAELPLPAELKPPKKMELLQYRNSRQHSIQDK